MTDAVREFNSVEALSVVSRPIGGAALTRRALTGELDEWYGRPPEGGDGWADLGRARAADFAGRAWREALAPAFDAHGRAKERLDGAQVVVTTGQQPGLFGGPLYTLHKALTALALADALERETGLPVAPVFWAATDDSDFAEASHVGIVVNGSVHSLRAARPDVPDGVSMSAVPLGDVTALRADLERACGSAASDGVLDALRRSYARDASVGGAYVALLRTLLEPLGIAVLDASHPSVRAVAAPVLERALRSAADAGSAVAERTSAIEAAGLDPQVAHVGGLSLVFVTEGDGVRRRVAIQDAPRVAGESAPEQLSPNVLLRPIVEREILPTLTYIGGPGEIAYFAQSSAVADALGVGRPLIVPRWSGFIIENDVAGALERLGFGIDDLRDPHAAEGRVAREEIAAGARQALTRLREAVARESDEIVRAITGDEALRRSVGSMRAGAEHRIARLERRLAATAKRDGAPRLRDVRLAQASLFPNAIPQERVLSFIPYLARYDGAVTSAIIAAAGSLASQIVRGG